MAEFSTRCKETVIADIRENIGDDAADRALTMHDELVSSLQGTATPTEVLSRVAEMLHNAVNGYGAIMQTAMQRGDMETFSGAMVGFTAGIHFVGSAIDIRVAEFTEAELFAGVEWDETGDMGTDNGETDA